MRLSELTQGALGPQVIRPAYDRSIQKIGIVHLGIGNFHRGHQAVYTDDAMAAGDRQWGITGVSMRSSAVEEQMRPQDCLYTVTERSGSGAAIRLISAIRSVIVAPELPERVVAALASADTSIVTLTVTEKGYCMRPDGNLDVAAQDVACDLQGNGRPRTIYGFLAAALAERRSHDRGGLTLLSCDNLAENGKHLARLLESYLEHRDTALADWFRSHCTSPSTMVDRIVPATTPTDRDTVAEAIGLRDEAAVITEPFRQWVIEDHFAGARPQWESAGAELVSDVRPFEAAKLRMLNGAHSALAYLGLLHGHEFVHQAIDDPEIRPVVERIMRSEAAATLDLRTGPDPSRYADALLARFANSALPHRLAQIATDGSQKITQRWLQPLAINRAAGRACPATLEALAGWLLYTRGDICPVDDPLANMLANLWRSVDRSGVVAALFGAGGLFSEIWTATPDDQRALTTKIAELTRVGRFAR